LPLVEMERHTPEFARQLRGALEGAVGKNKVGLRKTMVCVFWRL
jgi:hypothetical protein